MAPPAKHFSQTLIEVSREYKWTLYNLSTYNESCINSINNLSCIGIDSWYLQLSLDSSEIKDTVGKIWMYLCSQNDFEMSVTCEITLSSIKGTYVTKSFRRKYKSQSHYGVELIERDVLLDDLKKGNDTLIINCKLFNIRRPKLNLNPYDTLLSDIESLLTMTETCDITLTTSDGIEHQAHKAILMCRSRVFLAMFQSNMKESQDNLVKIEDVDSNILKEMLKFIYTGEIDNLESNAKKLFIVADKYELNDLRQICINNLEENMRSDNIFELMEFAHTYEICELKQETEKYFLKNHKEIVTTMGRETINNLSPHIATNLLYELATNQETKLSK